MREGATEGIAAPMGIVAEKKALRDARWPCRRRIEASWVAVVVASLTVAAMLAPKSADAFSLTSGVGLVLKTELTRRVRGHRATASARCKFVHRSLWRARDEQHVGARDQTARGDHTKLLLWETPACHARSSWRQLLTPPNPRHSLARLQVSMVLDHPGKVASVAKKAQVVVVSGPSGVGKGSIIQLVQQTLGPARVALCVSHTTRPPRAGEVEGEHYYFTSKQEMEQEISQGGFLELADVHGHLYGTRSASLTPLLEPSMAPPFLHYLCAFTARVEIYRSVAIGKVGIAYLRGE